MKQVLIHKSSPHKVICHVGDYCGIKKTDYGFLLTAMSSNKEAMSKAIFLMDHDNQFLWIDWEEFRKQNVPTQ